jgi:hypothetical protein
MIAPLRQIDPQTSGNRRRLGRVYRVIARALLPEQSAPTDDPPPVSQWRAWLFASWAVVVTVVYFIITLT